MQKRQVSGAFKRRRRAARGLPRYSDKDRAYDAARGQRNADLVAAYKLERGCADCGYREHHVALDLDHLDPRTKVRRVSAMRLVGRQKLMEEMAKCEVVCANCHRIRTYTRLQAARPE